MKEVVLGLPGPWATDHLEASDHYTTKVGGVPDWPFPESSLGPDLLQCDSCRSNLFLIAQVYAPISTATLKIEERIIYVFGCTNLDCERWRAIRIQKPNLKEPVIDNQFLETHDQFTTHSTASSTSASETNWWDDLHSLEPGSENGREDDDMNLLDLAKALSDAAFLASGSGKKGARKSQKTPKTCVETPKAHGETTKPREETSESRGKASEPHGKALSMVPNSREVEGSTLVLPCFYIYFEDNSWHSVATASSSNCSRSFEETLVNKDDNNEPVQEEAWEGEGYEYDKALNADRIYLKFMKRMDRCPEQCFRYSFGGKPLLAAGGFGDPGQCGCCGETRHYEMQLMPPLVYFLHEKATGLQTDLMDKWNWFTLMVFTCSKNCFENLDRELHSSRNGWTVVEETVIAQLETPLSESSTLGFFS